MKNNIVQIGDTPSMQYQNNSRTCLASFCAWVSSSSLLSLDSLLALLLLLSPRDAFSACAKKMGSVTFLVLIIAIAIAIVLIIYVCSASWLRFGCGFVLGFFSMGRGGKWAVWHSHLLQYKSGFVLAPGYERVRDYVILSFSCC